ncbi:MAG: aminotransferase class I/II-fold pyridoxal phosphate-dependent enzyme [Kiritimatiellae bacterium]|nr:aminotransferase class I/II-fold pyridoxal phosphate-dependent enzyme [Kiritimatiellia bacterium]
MRPDFLPFSKPTIDEKDIYAVDEVLRSGWITTGQNSSKFEEEFSNYTGAPASIALASATGGMHLALKALNIGPGDEVITPSLTWVSTANLIALSGARPVFVDVDRDTLMAQPELVDEVVTERTKLIAPVHFAGAPVDLDAFRQIAQKHKIPLIEDAAHAVGTEYKNRKIGSSGTAIFSFHPIKNITTGEGGMFCSDDAVLIERIRRLKFHGLGVDAFDRKMQGRSPQAEVVEPGYKYNLTDIAAALGRTQLKRLDNFIQKRSELAGMYREKLKNIPELIPLKDPAWPIRHAWHLFIVRMDVDRARISRDDFMEALKRLNIGTGLHFRAVHLQKFYREHMGFERGMLPATEWNSDRILSLPLFPDMHAEDVDDVIGAAKEVLAKKAGS